MSSLRGFNRVGLMFSFIYCCSITGFAQSKLDSIQHLNEIVVSARKTRVDIIPVQVLSGELLQNLSAHSVADALRYFSGVQLINIFIGSNSVRLEYGSESIIATLQEGNYPNYRSVLPQNNDKILSIGKADLNGAIKRVSVFANQASSLVKLELSKDLIKLSAQDIDFSTAADETVACGYTGTAMAIGFKGHLLTELISAIPSSDLQMSFFDPSRATLITPVDDKPEDKLTYLLMPMMLND